MVSCILPLRCTFQSYLWGESSNSTITKKFLKNHAALDTSKPIAELWFGSHKNGEATVFFNNSWIGLSEYWKLTGGTPPLNFLSKILCIKKPLSIQLHPAKQEALNLNRINPISFPDSNSKPEMAIALTPLQLLCGTLSLPEISKLLDSHPAFQGRTSIILKAALNSGGVRNLFKRTLELDQEIVKEFSNCISDTDATSPHDKIAKMLILDSLELDPGIIALYYLNYYKVEKGKAIYIQPKVPHAYIEGRAFECMQNSDNVVRGGLTTKQIDISNFCTLVNIDHYDPIQHGHNISDSIIRYTNDELPFILEVISTEKFKQKKICLEAVSSHEIIVVLSGTGTATLANDQFQLEEGTCFYSPSRKSLEIVGSDLQLFRVWSEASF